MSLTVLKGERQGVLVGGPWDGLVFQFLDNEMVREFDTAFYCRQPNSPKKGPTRWRYNAELTKASYRERGIPEEDLAWLSDEVPQEVILKERLKHGLGNGVSEIDDTKIQIQVQLVGNEWQALIDGEIVEVIPRDQLENTKEAAKEWVASALAKHIVDHKGQDATR